MSTDDSTILVTGASGFIATHIIQQLQQAGYKVRGTVRSTKNEAKIKPLHDLYPGGKHALELVEADLTKDDGWNEAVQGCRYVLHTASPFPNENPRHEDEVIKPAVDGTLRVLRACSQVGGVKKVVLTSSIASVTEGVSEGNFDESDWTDLERTGLAYYKSKTLAEKAAWDFLEGLDESKKFELAVVNPGYVIGPVLCGGWATSMEVPQRLLERKMPALPHIYMTIVDVRDVAEGHIIAMTNSEASGKRHILASHGLWMKDMAMILNEEFKPLGYNVPLREAPYCMVKFMSFFDKTVRLILPSWGKVATMDNSRMTSVLKINPRPAKDSFVDMAYSMIERGFIKKTNKYKNMKNSA